MRSWTLWLSLSALAVSTAANAARKIETRKSEFNGSVEVSEQYGVRFLDFESGGKISHQGAMSVTHPDHELMAYAQMMSLVTSLHPNPLVAFNFGLGAGVLPRFHLSRYPHASVDSVEIDPVVVDFEKKYFPVPSPAHRVLVGDGYEIMRKLDRKYDVIWLDAFGPDGVPSYQGDLEFLKTLRGDLLPGGMITVNFTSNHDLDSFLSSFRKLRPKFEHAIVVQADLAAVEADNANRILAFGNVAALSCASFLRAYDEWSKSSQITYWQPRYRDRLCREL